MRRNPVMGMFDSVYNMYADTVRGIVKQRLAQHGLKCDDIRVESDDMLTALNRIDGDNLEQREMRIKRAFDLSSKKKTMDEMKAEDPMDHYLTDGVNWARKEQAERKYLNNY